MQQKLENKRYYLIVDDQDYEVFPQSDITFKWSLNDNGFYEHELQGSIILSNHFDDIKQYHDDYDFVKQYESEIYLDFRVDKLCSGSYSEYWIGYIDMLGDWDDSASTFITSAKLKSGYNNLLDNIVKQFNIFNLDLTQVTTQVGSLPNLPFPLYYNVNYYFKDLIEAIISNILPTYTYESTFFDSATNPITGTSNEFYYLTIAQKQDVLEASTINNPTKAPEADKAILTFEEIINFVRMINVFPYVDEDNNIFRFEHKYFFENNLSYSPFSTVSIDLTTLDSGKYILNKSKYKYNTSKIYSKEILSYNEFGLMQFYDGVIEYDLKVLDDKINKYNSGRFTTDISYIYNQSEVIDKDGFVLIANESGLTVPREDIELNLKSTNYSITSYKCDATKENEDDPYIRIDNITGVTDDRASFSLIFDNLNSGDVSDGDKYFISIKLRAVGYSVAPFFIYIGEAAETSLPITNNLSNIWSSASFVYNDINDYTFTIQSTSSSQIYLNFLQATTKTDVVYISEIEFTKTLSKDVANTPFAWSNILHKYWLNGRVLLNGKINGDDKNFDTTNYLKEEEEIEGVPLCCDSFNTYRLVRTNIGDGVIQEAIEDKNGVFKFKIIHQ